MRIVFYLAITAVSALVTFGLSYLIWKLSTRYRLYPRVRERDVHTRPTPRLGGVAMFLGVVVAFGVASQVPNFSIVFSDPVHLKVLGLLGASFLIVLVGVIDDIWDLDWMTKLAGQVIAAGVLAWSGLQLYTLPIGGVTIVSANTSIAITVVVVVLVMNAVNFIDGLDGLVAGVVVIASVVFFIYSYLLQSRAETDYYNLASLTTAILIGCCLGFLPLNFYPARLFMGDAGALLVGLLMAASAISVTGQVDPGIVAQPDKFTGYFLPAFIPILMPFAVLVVPLLDFALAIFRRLNAGKSPFTADRKHLHHRLLDMGHTHPHAVLIFYAWTFVFSVGLIPFMFWPWYWPTLLILGGFLACTILTLAPLSRRKALEAAAQSAEPGEQVDPDVAKFDQLDAASVDLEHDEPERVAP